MKINELQESTEYKTEDPPKNPESSSHSMNMIPPVNVGAVKSDHLKLTFPTFGRPSDDSDPLLYLAKCQDFLALHPLTDSEILATFLTVLHGTARDWWEVVQLGQQLEKDHLQQLQYNYRLS